MGEVFYQISDSIKVLIMFYNCKSGNWVIEATCIQPFLDQKCESSQKKSNWLWEIIFIERQQILTENITLGGAFFATSSLLRFYVSWPCAIKVCLVSTWGFRSLLHCQQPHVLPWQVTVGPLAAVFTLYPILDTKISFVRPLSFVLCHARTTPPEIWNRLDWRALVELCPPIIEKLRG